METFTQEELTRIDEIAAGMVETPTVDDLDLWARWKSFQATEDAQFKARIKAIEDKTAADIENSKLLVNAAVDNLKAQKAAALKRLEVI